MVIGTSQHQANQFDCGTLLCILILLLLPFVLFWSVTTGNQIWAAGDFSAYHVPFYSVSSDQWRHGIIPLWNPELNGGTPLAAAQQAGVFYPLNILMWFLLPAWLAMGYSILAHLALAAVGTFVFLRSLRLHNISCLLGGLVFGLGGFIMSHLGHVAILRALPWIGFCLFAFNSWIDIQKPRYLVYISLSALMLFLSGYPQIVVYASILIGTYFLFARRIRFYHLAPVVFAVFLGACASAIQILPGIHLWSVHEFLRPGERIYEATNTFSFHPAYLVTLLFPNARLGTFAEMVGYVGVAPLFLALLSLITVGEDSENRLKRFFSIWAVVSMCLALGRYLPPLAKLVFHIPSYGDFGVPSKHLLEFSFSFAILSALGLEALIKSQSIKRIGLPSLAIVTTSVAAATVLGYFSAFSTETPTLKWVFNFHFIGKPVLLMASAFLLVLLAHLSKRAIRFSVALLLLLTLADLLDFGLPIYSGSLTTPDFYKSTPHTASILQRNLQENGPHRIISFNANGAVLNRDLAKELLATNYNATYRIESLIGFDGLQLRRFYNAFAGRIPPWGIVDISAIEDPHFRVLLNLYGVRYLLATTSESDSLSKFYHEVASTDGVAIFENIHAKARLFVADSPHLESPSPPRTEVRLISNEGHRITSEVNFTQTEVLVHGTNYVSGWEARIDGRRVPISPLEGALQAVSVPAGVHRVEFSYEPWSYKWGAAISLISLLLIGALGFIDHRLRTRT